MILSHYEHYFIFFNVYEHMAVPFAKLTRNRSRVSHLRFCLHRIILSGHSYSYTGDMFQEICNIEGLKGGTLEP